MKNSFAKVPVLSEAVPCIISQPLSLSLLSDAVSCLISQPLSLPLLSDAVSSLIKSTTLFALAV